MEIEERERERERRGEGGMGDSQDIDRQRGTMGLMRMKCELDEYCQKNTERKSNEN